MNIFEQATRKKLRFTSVRGELTVEQLWDLPLTSRNSFDLDSVAKAVNADLRSVSEESFVTTRVHPAKADHELRLELVKHVIAVRMDEEARRKDAALKASRKAQILELLAKKDEEEMLSKSKDELLRELEELSRA